MLLLSLFHSGTNYAYELYKEQHGEEEFNRKIKEGQKVRQSIRLLGLALN